MACRGEDDRHAMSRADLGRGPTYPAQLGACVLVAISRWSMAPRRQGVGQFDERSSSRRWPALSSPSCRAGCDGPEESRPCLVDPRLVDSRLVNPRHRVHATTTVARQRAPAVAHGPQQSSPVRSRRDLPCQGARRAASTSLWGDHLPWSRGAGRDLPRCRGDRRIGASCEPHDPLRAAPCREWSFALLRRSKRRLDRVTEVKGRGHLRGQRSSSSKISREMRSSSSASARSLRALSNHAW